MSAESKKKMSEAKLKNPSKYWLGKKRSVEDKKKMSKKRTVRWNLSVETRRKMGVRQKGELNHNWKGGVETADKVIRKSFEYKLWRKSVFERDNYQCIWGGKEHGSKLQADHIKPFCDYPELRFAIDNGRTLCIDCHRKTDTYGKPSKKKRL